MHTHTYFRSSFTSLCGLAGHAHTAILFNVELITCILLFHCFNAYYPFNFKLQWLFKEILLYTCCYCCFKTISFPPIIAIVDKTSVNIFKQLIHLIRLSQEWLKLRLKIQCASHAILLQIKPMALLQSRNWKK